MAGKKAVATVQELEQNLNAQSNSELRVADNKIKSCYKRLLQEKKARISISPMYAPYVGDSLCVSINGYPVYIPVDGQAYEIPESYADIANEMIERIDDSIRAAKNMSNIPNNCEQFAGAKSFISRA